MSLIRGTNGGDILSGTGMDDILVGLNGRDELNGLAGNDIISGGNGVDTIDGGSGDDILIGGQDRLADLIYGGAGNDMIVAAENDTIYGGKGQDTLVVSIYNPFTAMKLDFSKIHGSTPQLIGFGQTAVAEVEKIQLDAYLGAGSTVIGTQFADQIFGIAVDADPKTALTINGAGGNDIINGSDYKDVLKGGTGDDIIDGGWDADRLYGGTGDDLFRLSDSAFGADKIMDFQPGSDALWVDQIDPDTGLAYEFIGLDVDNPLVSGTDPTRNSAGGQFLYDTDNGKLSYENGPISVLIAVLRNAPVITADDFLIASL